MPRPKPTESRPITARAVPGWVLPLVTVAAIVIALHPFWNRSIIFKDALQTFAPYKALIAKRLAAGDLALWYPWSFLGMPFVGNVEAGWFYPLNALYLVLPFEPAHRLFILGHLPIAALAMTALLRGRGLAAAPALFGGLAYALGGTLVCQHATVTMLIGAAWAPLALHLADRALRGALAWAAAAGGVIALQVLGGDPQTAIVTGFVVAVVCAPKVVRPDARGRAVAVLAVTSGSSLALAAAQIAPTWEMMRRTVRGAGLDLDEALTFSFHPGRVIELIWPTPFGNLWPDVDFWGRFALDGSYDNPWAITHYLGLPVMALAVWGAASRRRTLGRWALLGAGVFLLIALGRHTPLYGALHRAVPLFDLFRYPEKFMVGVAACLAAAAAAGLDEVHEDLVRRPAIVAHRARAFAIASGAGVALAALLAPRLVEALVAPGVAGGERAAAVRHLWVGGAEVLIVSLGAAALVRGAAMGRISRPAAFAAFLVLTVADWSHANVRRMPRGPAALYEERPIAARILEPRGPTPPGTYRIFREAMPFRDRGPRFPPEVLARQRVWERNTLVRNLDAMEGFEDLVGYSSSKLVDGLQVLKKGLSPRMLEIYNVRYVLSRYGRSPIDGIRTETVHASPEDDLTITRLVDARPRAYWAGSYRLTRDEAEALAVLRSPEAGDVITIQAEPGLTEAKAPGPVPLRPAAISHYEPDRVVVRVDAPSDGWLVLSDRYDPAWTATVDGREAPIHRANVMVRAVRIPAGGHEAVFTYRPAVIAWGIAVTLLGWLGASLWWGASWLSRRATPRTSRVGIDDTGAPS